MQRFVTTIALALSIAGSAAAQNPVPVGPMPGQGPGQGPGLPPQDPLARFLFPPEMVMQHQSEIGLTDAQRAAISKDIAAAQAKFIDMQWKMSGEMEKLTRLLNATPIDEAQTLEQLDRILTAEREVKKAQIGLLVRIKNVLTRDQQTRLDTFRFRRDD